MKDRETNEIDDKELRARFTSLRQNDSRSEPEFRAMLERAQSDALKPNRTLVPALRWVAIAASIVVAAAVFVGKTRQSSSGLAGISGAGGSDWQSPTAGLLNPHVRGLMAPPPLLSSVFDGVVPPTLQQASE